MSALPTCIRTAAGVRELDRIAIEETGIPGYTLMTRAGEGAFADLRNHWPDALRVLVVCGAGNNGGDGYVLARVAIKKGVETSVVALSDPGKLTGDALTAYEDFVNAGGSLTGWSGALLDCVDVAVDAMLGTGLDRPLRKDTVRVVEALNQRECALLAIDVPTGLNADTGEVMGAAVRADVTATFVGLKQGFYLGSGMDCTGAIEFHDLGVSPDAVERVPCTLQRIDEQTIVEALPKRARTSHKGANGHVVLIGGGPGMGGAVLLAGEAALCAGAGLVTIATCPEHVDLVVSARPELMCKGVESFPDLQPLMEKADVLAIGPGLGQSDWAREIFQGVINHDASKVVDADALNLLAQEPRSRGDWILTPHPGEAGRLLRMNTAAIQKDRLESVQQLAARYGGIAVLKGAGTLVARSGTTPWVCDRGNPGMAAPGMGDVLTGITAGILAQCSDLERAACAAVLIHAQAGDEAAAAGERGTHASELFGPVRRLVNP